MDLVTLMTLVRWPDREEVSPVARVVEVPDGRLTTPVINWAEFADGRVWELVRGEDFHQEPARANRAARQWASNHGYHCQAHKESTDKIRVKFTKVVIPNVD